MVKGLTPTPLHPRFLGDILLEISAGPFISAVGYGLSGVAYDFVRLARYFLVVRFVF